ncbi:GPW/gp25 family protein [Thiomicrorhabdus sp.]|uniref:GPW/gp25 family protein n=1 Tax=Thiomicrorhabdus sp. TaxID=2039724 RepID=UPI0029C8AF18|nr:GPW/gp25 family protein [Thiomicrorhabdus sp.]
MDRISGKVLNELAHLKQSVQDILSTPIGSRVMRPEYGSRLPELVDAPLNHRTKLSLIAATADALAIWEPRLKVEQIQIVSLAEGKAILDIQGQYLPSNGTLKTLVNLESITV